MLDALFALTLLAAGGWQSAWDFYGDAAHRGIMTTAAYDDALRSLTRQFDAICGDTFCEGDYSNLTSLGFECSVHAETQQVGQCVWTLAGSYAEVDPGTGKVAVTKRVFECDLGFKGDAKALAKFLRAAAKPGASHYDGLRSEPVPGSGKDLMSTLTDCL